MKIPRELLFIYLCYGVSSSLVSPDAMFYVIF